MSVSLLSTKLYVPPLRVEVVSRPRLSETLLAGAKRPGSFVLLSAPAGFGKTTLLSEFVAQFDRATVWLSLDEGDNDPIRFWTYLITACQSVHGGVGEAALALLRMSPSAPVETIPTLLINDLAGKDSELLLILDDFHLIKNHSIHTTFSFLLNHLPDKLHIVLSTRSDPPWPLARWRVRNQLVEVRAADLRFTTLEATAFLNRLMGLNLATEEVIALENRTEGWIAGLQLAALSMKGRSDTAAFIKAFTGSHVYIAEYLVEEVLQRQPEDIQAFLLQTSFLERLNAGLCEAVTGCQDGQAVLMNLHHANLFVLPLDDQGQWFRYHHLFADVLSLRLGHMFPQQLPELHRRASHWYEQHEMISEAIYHASMAGDQARTVQLVEQNGCSLLMRGEGFTLLKWVKAVESYTQTHPWLAILKAWGLALTGHLDNVEPTLQAAEGLISSPELTIEVRIMLGAMAAVRAYLANVHGEAPLAVDYAQAALEYLPDGNAFSCSLRSVAVSILGDASWMTGDLQDARQAYVEAEQISQAAGNIYMTMIANSNLAEVLTELGDLSQAARIYSDTLRIATRPDGGMLPLADRLYAGLGKISYEWNDLEAAAQYIHQCIELCQQWENFYLLAESYVLLSRLERARCNLEQARAAMRTAEQMTSEKCLSPMQSVWMRYACARWWIEQRNLEKASHLIQHSGKAISDTTPDAGIPYTQERDHLLLLRLWLAQGDHEAALSLSETLLSMAEDTKRVGRVIEILTLQALALQGMHNMAPALAVLGRALSLAQPQGYRRVFLDEGEPMAKLLYQAKSQRVGGEYTVELLSALGAAPATELPPARLLIEPLTLRELEVLKLIEAGHSNQDIAGRLVISVPTVKRHISNIYGKLGAKSRTQAVSLGKELRLFE